MLKLLITSVIGADDKKKSPNISFFLRCLSSMIMDLMLNVLLSKLYLITF